MSNRTDAGAPQPMPTPNARPSIVGLVIHDLAERAVLGRKKYGTDLQAHNGRDPLVDAYQENLDECMYLRQEIEERTDLRAQVAELEAAQQRHLALIAKLSNETPFDDEIKGWETQRAKMIAEVGTLRATLAERDARHDSSMRYLRDIENMASTGTQSAVMREDGDGALRLSLFRDIRTAARSGIAGDGLRLNEAVEIDHLTDKAAKLEAERDAEIATARSYKERYEQELRDNVALGEERDRLRVALGLPPEYPVMASRAGRELSAGFRAAGYELERAAEPDCRDEDP